MSVRADFVRDSLRRPFDPLAVKEGATEDVVLNAPAIGPEVTGRDAVAEAIETFFIEARPTYRLEGDLVEQGDFVVAFAEASVAGETRHLCLVYRFEGDLLSGLWVVRA